MPSPKMLHQIIISIVWNHKSQSFHIYYLTLSEVLYQSCFNNISVGEKALHKGSSLKFIHGGNLKNLIWNRNAWSLYLVCSII